MRATELASNLCICPSRQTQQHPDMVSRGVGAPCTVPCRQHVERLGSSLNASPTRLLHDDRKVPCHSPIQTYCTWPLYMATVHGHDFSPFSILYAASAHSRRPSPRYPIRTRQAMTTSTPAIVHDTPPRRDDRKVCVASQTMPLDRTSLAWLYTVLHRSTYQASARSARSPCT